MKPTTEKKDLDERSLRDLARARLEIVEDETALVEQAAAAPTADRLVDAALEAFIEHGFEHSRVQDIARRAGFTTGAIYGRFQGKTALLSAVIGREGERFLGIALAALANSSEVASVLRALAVDTQAGPPVPIHTILTDACAVAVRDDDVRAALLPLFDRIRTALCDAVLLAQQQGRFDPDVDADAVVHMATTLMLGSFLAKALRIEQPGFDAANQLMDRVVGAVADAPAS